MNKIILAFLGLSLLIACSSTQIVSSWKEPGTTISANQIDKIVFIALVKNEPNRKVVEDKLASLANGKGLASYTFIQGSELSDSDKTAITQRLKAEGADLVVIMRLLDVEEETRFVPSSGMNAYGGAPGYMGYWAVYSHAAPMYYSPGYYTTDKKYWVETKVYSVDQEKLLWSGTTASMNPSEIESTTQEIVEAVIDKMKEEGFLI